MINSINKNIKVITAVLFVMLFALNFKVTAQTKNTIEFKTSIINQSEQPMPDGNYNFRFAIYNAASGGTALWSEDRFGVPVRKAAISVDLGSFVPFPQNLFKNTSLYLQICLDANLAGGDGSGECAGSFEENFKPRKVMTGVPWAFNAGSLGPVTVSNGDTAYNLDTFGSDSTLLSLGFNDVPKFSVDSKGTIKLTEESDLFFGDNISLKNSDSAETAGANLIGVYSADLQNITGSTLQSVLTNIDPLLRWRANGSSVYYNGGNVGIGTNGPSYTLDVMGTGRFTNGIIIGNNTNNVAGAIRWTGSAFEGNDGVSWNPLGGGSGATTDNGAGLTYVTNTTNSFAIGGTTTLAPYVFDPVAGALIKRNVTLRNDPATSMPNMLTIDSSGANAQVGGNKNGITGNFAYTPNGGTGAEIYNTQESVLVVNPGDGSDINRVRGYRTTITNNSSGVVDGAFNLSAINTNNGTEQFQTGLNATLQNNGTLTGQMNAVSANANNSGDSGLFTIGTASTATNNVGGITDQLTATYNQTTNNGTTDYQYGSRNVVNNNGTVNNQLWATLNGLENDGTAQVAYGLQTNFLNHPAGIVNSDSFGINNDNTNQGTVNANLYGIYNNISNTGTVVGNIIGLQSGDGTTLTRLNVNGTYAITTTGGAVKFSNQAIVGNSTGVDEAGAIRWTGAAFEGYDGISWNSLGGVGTTQWGNTGGGDIFFDTGFVGIGTNAPSVELDVNGASRITSLGVGQLNDGSFALEVAGAAQFGNEIVVGNSLADTAGAIRWTGTAFEGYDGATWNSLGGGATSPWVNDGSGNYYYNLGNISVGGVPSNLTTFEVQGTTYMTGSLGVGAAPSGSYMLEVSGSTLTNDLTVNGAVAIGTGGDPGGVYALEVTGNSRFNDPIGLGTDFNNLFILNIQGDVNINGNEFIQNGALCVDGGTGCPVLSPGGIYGDLAYSEFDVAENILAQSNVEAGDLVSAQEGQVEVVRKSNFANESNLLGIISTDPGSLGGVQLKARDGFIVVPLVLSGRVPVKVSTENGTINVGDPITSSSVAGVAMKATQSKAKIVGYAMQGYDAAGVSKIIVFYQPGYLP